MEFLHKNLPQTKLYESTIQTCGKKLLHNSSAQVFDNKAGDCSGARRNSEEHMAAPVP